MNDNEIKIVKILTRPTIEELQTAISVLQFFRDEEHILEEHSNYYCNCDLDIQVRNIKVFLENQLDDFYEFEHKHS